tara:strand:- start:11762 stop:13093 length:1332 start_codon:yes stop_codon:yes gene_type:complete
LINEFTLKVGILQRKAAWEVLQAVSAGAYADFALDRVVRKYGLKGVDRSLVTELAYGSIRYRSLLDSWIDHLGKLSANKQPPLLRLLLHVGLYQILKMERIPESAAINTTVELAKCSQLVKLAPVVNGFLRSVCRFIDLGKKLPSPIKTSERLAQEQSLPVWLTTDLISWCGEIQAENVAKAFNKTPSFDLRVNSIRESQKNVQRELQSEGIRSNYIEGIPNGLVLNNGLGDLQTWPGYSEGKWCVQDRSSQWVSPLLEPQSGENILDACSAPGSKTTHLAELIGDEGEIWAVDRSLSRLKLVAANASRLGIECINVLKADALNLLEEKPDWKGYFHRILVDAPCSGLGTLARHPDARWRMTPEKVDELVILQERLLNAIFPMLRPGGRLVYSTCTINPNENFRQVERFVSRHPQIKLQNQKQIWPCLEKGGDGFYAAVIENT